MEKISNYFKKVFQPPYIDAWTSAHIFNGGLGALLLNKIFAGLSDFHVILVVFILAWVWEGYELIIQTTKESYWNNKRWRIINTLVDVFVATLMAAIVIL